MITYEEEGLAFYRRCIHMPETKKVSPNSGKGNASRRLILEPSRFSHIDSK